MREFTETTIGAELERFGLAGRIDIGTNDLATPVARIEGVSTYRNRLVVHVGGGVALYSWAQVGGHTCRFPLQVGFAVVIVDDHLKLVQTA